MEDLHDDVIVVALHELRETRRRRRLGDWSPIDALYKAYVSGLLAALTVTMLSGVVGDRRLTASQVVAVQRHGPAVVGLVIALALAAALRTGARGGPIAVEAADVRHVMLAPVDRDVALRPPALRQLRFATFVGLVTGSAVGLLAYRRLPGAPAAWITAGALVGTAAGLGWVGAAMVASGRRLRSRSAVTIGAVAVGWSVVDVVTAARTSPASMLGQVGLWPLDFRPAFGSAVAAAPLLALAGLAVAGGVSLEAAERRARLITHLRFAATFQDLRTVVLLRRQLAAELPRSKPWILLRPARRGPVVWRRDWRGIMRWPLVRIVRLLALGALAGAATAAAWAGTTAMVVVAGGALFVAAIDAIEGLSEEVDHPDRRDSFPMARGALHLRHLLAPVVVLTLVTAVGVAVAAAAGGGTLAVEIGVTLLVPTAAMAVGGAVVNTLREPADWGRLMVDPTGTAMLFRLAFPPALATAGPGAAVVVHRALDVVPQTEPVEMARMLAIAMSVVVVIILGWVRHRESIARIMPGRRPAPA